MTPASELDAVNAMLSAVGEAPVASLSGTLPTNVTLARNLLSLTTREVQSEGWRFNTEFAMEIAPTATLEWTSTLEVTQTLNIFKAPDNLASFTVARIPSQQGQYYVDTVISPSRVYRESGLAVPVFYDRVWNRDGFADRPYLYINPVWLFDYAEMPSTARDFVLIKASRRFQQDVAGSADLAGLKLYDEQQAEKRLRKDQGQKDDHNIFKNQGVARIFGRRPFGAAGSFDYRATPGRKP